MSCTILSNVNLITSRVELAFKNSKCVTKYPKIVAVSKFKTIENIIEAYNCGLRFFGENYVQELLKKAQDEKVITNCPDIKWHFIGKLQSKNVNKILRVPNLYVIETLESIDIAKSLNEKLGNLERKEKLKVMIQINTSGDDAKGGISPEEVVEFTSKIIQNFENLNFIGLMTIGAIHNVIQGSSNPDFVFPEIVKDSSGEEIHITYSKQSTGPDRQTWGGKIEFLCSCVAMAVGLGNVWRFPYLCYKNGGGAFLVPYFSMLFLVGLPLFFMELAFGQFASLGPITVWSISPLFKGIGYGMVLTSFILSTYYNVIIAQSLYYLFASLNSVLPWMYCDKNIKNSSCFDSTMDPYNWSLANPNSTKVSPSEQYFEKTVLNESDSIWDIGAPQWKLCLCLLLAWIVVLAVLLKGINSLGKVAYFTAIFPYIILFILLIRGCTLPGAVNGIIFYIKPRFDKIRDSKVWTDAATQIFFSLSCCNGNLITMSSYNNFKNNCCRDAVFVAILNCATSIFAGFVIFSNLGFMALMKNTTIDSVVAGGPGLAFIVYPEALTHMFLAPLWSVFFFLMMITLGFGSQFAIVETVLAGIQDELRRLKLLKSQIHVIIFRVSICVLCFVLGIPMTCRGGMYILNMLDYVISGYVLLVLALLEIIVICYFYGINRFRKDIALMTTKRPNWYWRIMWMYISPAVITFLIIFYFITGDTLKYGSYSYPKPFITLSHIIALFPLIFVPAVFLYRYCKEGGWIILREVIKPKSEWGPADEENRQVFISSIMRMDEQSNAISGSKEAKMPSPDNMSTPLGDSFFQSKRSLLSKFSEVAAKENSKNTCLKDC